MNRLSVGVSEGHEDERPFQNRRCRACLRGAHRLLRGSVGTCRSVLLPQEEEPLEVK